jgi:hypothetical protein
MSTTLEPEPAQVLTRLAAYPWLVVATTCIGAFMGQLDASIVQLAMPEFERVFNLRVSDVSWIARSRHRTDVQAMDLSPHPRPR